MARSRKKKSKKKTQDRPWLVWSALVIVGAVLMRLAVNSLGLVPVHFDEAQYWAYGHELAAGHFSKPPLVGWLILIATELGGDTTFALRIWAVISHAVVAGMIFLTGRALFDGRTGFWAAAGYTVAPGVSVSAMIMSTDPVMMMGWAVALYAWVRAAQAKSPPVWWAVCGLALGAAMLAKYTALAFAGGMIGYGLLSLRSWDWRGAAIVALAAFLVFSPNLIWQIDNSFHTVSHVAEDAAPGGSLFNPGKFAEFFGAQFGVIGPVWFVAMLVVLWKRKSWIGDWRMRLLAWQAFPLLIAITALSLTTRAHANWAAPGYIAGSIMAAHWLLSRKWFNALKWQSIIGVAGATAVFAMAVVYGMSANDLPRGPDPFKKMRISEPFCEPALAAMGAEGADVLLSTDRRRLSECMFLGGLSFDQIAVWNPDLNPKNHHELVATLWPGDHRRMVLAIIGTAEAAAEIVEYFDFAQEIETETFATHANRQYTYTLWSVEGFRDY
ncbi:MAG: glycosyltransferase family 39 protein [Pseudomonadota bacterium]